MSGSSDERILDSERALQSDRETDRFNDGGPTSSSLLPQTANASDKISPPEQDLRKSLSAKCRMQAGVKMVDSTPRCLERQVLDHPGTRHGLDFRCVKERVGGNMGGSDNPRVVESGGNGTPHKCPGAVGSNFCSQVIHTEQEKSPYSSFGRQFGDSSPYHQNGGNQVGQTRKFDEGTLGVLFSETDHSYCKPHSGYREYQCRPAVSGVLGLEQLETRSASVSEVEPSPGTSKCGSVCRQVECPVEQICQLETGSSSHGNRCFPTQLGGDSRLCLPAVLHDREVPEESGEGALLVDNYNPSMAFSTLVSTVVGNVSRTSCSTPQDQEFVDIPQRGEAPSDGSGNPISSGMENFRQQVSASGVSDHSAKLMSKSWRPGTQVAYNSAWKKWTGWCGERQLDPFQTSVDNIINFLGDLHAKGYQYSTINGYRSALSALHCEIDGHKAGQHPLVIRLMKGVFNDRPPVPRYSETWDVGVVLSHIKGQGDNNVMSIKTLTHKLAMLIAVTSACRGSELKLIDPTLSSSHDQALEFHLPGLTKSKRQTKPHHSITLAKYASDACLDVIDTFEVYIKRTKGWRTSHEQKHQLFLAIVEPHKPVVPSTIANWLKSLMEAAGVDTETFKAHSTRAASTSKAKFQGLSVEQIVKRGNWSNASTFQRFYYKSIKSTTDSESYTKNVLSGL